MNNIIILYMNNDYKMLKIMYENLHNFLHYSVHNYLFNCCIYICLTYNIGWTGCYTEFFIILRPNVMLYIFETHSF